LIVIMGVIHCIGVKAITLDSTSFIDNIEVFSSLDSVDCVRAMVAAASSSPSSYSLLPLFILLLFFLLLSALFSGSETALFSLDKMRLNTLSQRHPHLSRPVLKMLQSPNETLTTILLGNTIVNIAAALCAGILAERYIQHSPVLSFIIGAVAVAIVILIVGEITPKTIGISHAESFALLVGFPLLFWHYLIVPFRELIHIFTDSVLKILHVEPALQTATLSEEEIKILLATSEVTNILPEDEQEMIEGVLELGDTIVEEVMTPRMEIEAYPIDLDRTKLLAALKEGNHNRVIIYKNQIDNVVGVLHAKDLFLNPDKPLEELLREPVIAPPTQPLIALLRDFQQHHSHLSIVVDEYGGIAGVVTLQDVLEEIVSELEETSARRLTFIQKTAENEYLVSGSTEVWRINEELGLNLSEKIAQTIAGFVINTLERIPEKDEALTVNGVEFIVVQKTKRRLTQIKIIIHSLPNEAKNNIEQSDK